MLIPVKKQRLSKTLYVLERPFELRMDGTNNMEYTEDEYKDASAFCTFYLNLIHSFNDKSKYFFSENVTLDYFGHTIRGQINVTNYIKTNLVNVGHLFDDPKPVRKIGFRDSHVIKLPSERRKVAMPFFSPPKSNQMEPKTPTKAISQPSTSRQEQGKRNVRKRLKDFSFPAKRSRRNRGGDQTFIESPSENEVMESELDPVHIKYMMSEGNVEFRKQSLKKLQHECRWRRPCKLSIAYSSTSNQDCSIYLIIYEGNVKCRRNLLKEFEEAELQN